MEFKNSHVLVLCITAFLAMAGGALIAPALPEMVEPLHTTTHNVGLLMSVYALATAICTLVIGHFIDQVNRKKILVPCLVIYGLTGFLSYFVSDFQLLLALRFIQGSGVAGMTILALLIIGDVYPGRESVKPISRVSMSLALGAISAPLIGGGLAMIGWNYPFLFYALSLPFALLVLVYLPETRIQKECGNDRGIREVFTVLKQLPVLFTIFLGFAIYFLLFSLVIYVPFMVKNVFGFGSGESGLMLGIEGIAVIFMASRVNTLTERFSVTRIIIAGFVLVGISLIAISWMHSLFAVIVLLLLFGAGYGLAQTAIDVQIVNVSPAPSRGGILSLHTCMKYIGMTVSPVIMGEILLYSDLYTVFIVAGFLGVFVALLTYSVRKQLDISSDIRI
ncbi:MAG: MFS transporter [Methanospirillum sp.]|uniref:MFS transporter n=1 Tax=Methanospirillum sp. TaxID=45200 RepID=UPI0023711934|nr:MFS transporter [Methanospirillum sp.]MDD1730000.1 MFS transporter [Methanospirillum sp.]